MELAVLAGPIATVACTVLCFAGVPLVGAGCLVCWAGWVADCGKWDKLPGGGEVRGGKGVARVPHGGRSGKFAPTEKKPCVRAGHEGRDTVRGAGQVHPGNEGGCDEDGGFRRSTRRAGRKDSGAPRAALDGVMQEGAGAHKRIKRSKDSWAVAVQLPRDPGTRE